MIIDINPTTFYSEISKDIIMKLRAEHKKILRDAFLNNLVAGSGERAYFHHNTVVDVYNGKYVKDLVSFGLLCVRDEQRKYHDREAGREVTTTCKCVYLSEYGIEICRYLDLAGRKNQSGHNSILADFIVSKEKEDLLIVGDMEIQTKYGVSRPDVLTMKKTLNVKYMCPVAYEIKHSRADFLSDIKNENKRKSYLEIADKLYYVCPDKLIKKEEMPEGCGLIYQLESGAFKIVKSAKNSKVDINVQLMMKLLLRVSDVNNTILIKPDGLK